MDKTGVGSVFDMINSLMEEGIIDEVELVDMLAELMRAKGYDVELITINEEDLN